MLQQGFEPTSHTLEYSLQLKKNKINSMPSFLDSPYISWSFFPRNNMALDKFSEEIQADHYRDLCTKKKKKAFICVMARRVSV